MGYGHRRAGRLLLGVFGGLTTSFLGATIAVNGPLKPEKDEDPPPPRKRNKKVFGQLIHDDFQKNEKFDLSQRLTPWNRNWDRREVEEEDDDDDENPKPKASRHLILIRHGQYNLSGASDSQRYLTDLGREQAKLTGQRLAQLNHPWTHIISSNMTRANETADIISQQFKEYDKTVERLPSDSMLREGGPIRPEPATSTRHPDKVYHIDGCRIEAAFRKYFHRADPEQEKDSFEIIVCHANVIRYFFCRALQFPPEAWLRISLKNASLTWITIRPDGRVSTRGLGDSGHFPPEKLTTT